LPEYTLEPELTTPPPRRVRAREGCGHGCGLWGVRLFIMPHTLAGVFLASQAVSAILIYLGVLFVGTEVEGRIVKKTATPGKKQTYYEVEYVFTLNGNDYADKRGVDAEDYAAINEGQRISVRVLAMSPQSGHWPGIPRASPISQVAGTIFGALLWNGILSVFLWYLYVRPWRQRQLVRYGEAVAGTVSEVKSSPTKGGTAYTITYQYRVPFDPKTGDTDRHATGKVRLEPPQSAADVQPGDLLTVLYDPRKPTRSTLYRFSDYKAE
jgi:Protein of unknown function (DUF3592)